ncbi:DEAD/DEAH box helicase [archaeon]|jgi:helicase|nr:DEAD/DEAH box helicase [archaeon]MBT3451149.1 DEAD/DEAH box helicase [archaeon]MBT6869300.1 DEAD/DEAH box helicase [archaeon]MBT7192463.1 DEAD/DEAH box helicase [archaeon]MBT7380539.1 DEAD/DEAH box helicase [archaeon]
MKFQDLSLPKYFKEHYTKFPTLNPVQEKSINAGLLDERSLLICAPTASGKTMVATMAIVNHLSKGKVIYLVPLRALANEKYKEYQELLKNTEFKVVQSTGEIDSDSPHLANYDLLILTTEKLDSLIRHKVKWLSEIKLVVIDEVHLLNDPTRGPTLEIIITLLKRLISPQIIALSATIGNPKALADWLNAELVIDNWRPVELKQGTFCEGKLEFY